MDKNDASFPIAGQVTAVVAALSLCWELRPWDHLRMLKRRYELLLLLGLEIRWLLLVIIGLIHLLRHLDIVLVVVLAIDLRSMAVDYWPGIALLLLLLLLLRIIERLRMLAGNLLFPLIHIPKLLLLLVLKLMVRHLWLAVIVLYQPLLLIDTCL